MSLRVVEIHYRRPPDRIQIFRQTVVAECAEFVVTFMESAEVRRPLVAEGRKILEPGSPVVWFTYPDRWYDVGRFHLPDGTFTGLYANILTPVQMHGARWDTTDLCLDVWLGVAAEPIVLDEEELDQAVAKGWLDGATAVRARAEAAALLADGRRGIFPQGHVEEWTLDRARAAAGAADRR